MAVSWGILSTARINDWVLEATRDSATVDFVAVGGRDLERTERWAATRGLERAYGSYQEVLADSGVQAVYISLPNALHVEWTVAALRAGKHVLCEKPFGRDPVAVAEGAAIAEDAGLVLAEAFMYRYHPQTQLARDLIAAGRIGALRELNSTMSFQMGQADDDPRLRPEMQGGALMDVGCYCVSAVRLFAGEPEAVYAEYRHDGEEVDLRVGGVVSLASGVAARFDAAMNLPRRDRLELVGEEGTITIADPWHCRLPAIELRRAPARDYGPPHPSEGVEMIALDPDGSLGLTGELADAYRFEFDAISAAIEAGGPPAFGAADALAQSRVLEALHRSATGGVRIELQDEKENVG